MAQYFIIKFTRNEYDRTATIQDIDTALENHFTGEIDIQIQEV